MSCLFEKSYKDMNEKFVGSIGNEPCKRNEYSCLSE